MLESRDTDEERSPTRQEVLLCRGEDCADRPVERQASGEGPTEEERNQRHDIHCCLRRLAGGVARRARRRLLAHRHRHTQLDEGEERRQHRQDMPGVGRRQICPEELEVRQMRQMRQEWIDIVVDILEMDSIYMSRRPVLAWWRRRRAEDAPERIIERIEERQLDQQWQTTGDRAVAVLFIERLLRLHQTLRVATILHFEGVELRRQFLHDTAGFELFAGERDECAADEKGQNDDSKRKRSINAGGVDDVIQQHQDVVDRFVEDGMKNSPDWA